MSHFCLGAASSFGILSGESGTGKTSFLQAGLLPNLEKQGHHPIYVKFTDSPPLASIRQSLKMTTEETLSDDDQSLVKLLRAATQNDTRPVVLIFDQFEQFFAHYKTKQLRKPFIQQMATWSKQSVSLPVKILVSIRSDFADRLIEFQREMEYTLTIHSNLRLEKFEPQEAANVINVIARETKIELDEGFVKDFTRQELADREDGTVSPVDIQILSWMIAGQKSAGERAFNRKAFQQLGGVEGLLERFLNRALNARETVARRQAAIKVMLALTDGNVRSGALSLKRLKEKLHGIIRDSDIEEAVTWLERGDVRLITPIQEGNITLYELAHERIIPPLRRLAFKEITDVEKAQQTLDRRVNEWIGNNRLRRYLLTLKEWLLIRRYWTLITLDKQKEQKKEFISVSRRRFINNGGTAAFFLLLWLWVLWDERKPKTKMRKAQEQLLHLLERNNEATPIQNSALLLPLLGDDSADRAAAQSLRQHIDKLPPPERARILSSLTNCYILTGNHNEALNTLNAARALVHHVDGEASVLPATILPAIAESYIKLGKNDEALDILNEVFDMLREIPPLAVDFPGNNQAAVLSAIAEDYVKLEKNGEALKALNKALLIKELPSTDDVFAVDRNVLSAIAKGYVKLGENNEASNGLKRVLSLSERRLSFVMTDVLSAIAESYIDLGKSSEALDALKKARYSAGAVDFTPSTLRILQITININLKLGKNDDASNALSEMVSLEAKYSDGGLGEHWPFIVETYIKLGKPEEALNNLGHLWPIVERLDVSKRLDAFLFLAEAYIKLRKTNEALYILDYVQETARKSGESVKNSALLKIAVSYAKLKEWEKALTATQLISSESYQIMASSRILSIWKSSEKFNLIEDIYWSGSEAVTFTGKTVAVTNH